MDTLEISDETKVITITPPIISAHSSTETVFTPIIYPNLSIETPMSGSSVHIMNIDKRLAFTTMQEPEDNKKKDDNDRNISYHYSTEYNKSVSKLNSSNSRHGGDI